MLAFNLLGPVELLRDGQRLHTFRSQKEPALLIYLAQTGQAHQRDGVAELLWESESTSQARSNLRTVLARLRKYAGETLEVTHKSLAFAPELRQHVDSVRLLHMLTTIRQVDSAASADALHQALAAYRGDFLADFQLRNAPRFDEWAITTREFIHRQVVAAYHTLGQYVQSAGDTGRSIAVARSWLKIDPLDEDAHTLLIRSLLEAGETREALAQYERGAALLRRELGADPPLAMSALVKDTLPRRPATLRPLAPPHNLPAAHDQFFGREAIQQTLHTRLNQPWCRLLTIAGAGGIGKTRLATTVARQRLAHYPDGIWLVELADLDPSDDALSEAIAVEIAAALKLRFAGSAPPSRQLLDYLQHKQTLLVLDNLEHVLAGSQLILDILRRCEQVQLLATSRQALHVRAEWVVTLEGLAYPHSDSDSATCEAVALFTERRAQRQSEALSDTDQAAIRAICRMVEGMPLAIELAAALAGQIAPQALAEHLHSGFGLLATSLHDMPQRHQSLRRVFEMSWRTLSPALQQCLARLSVLRGGCTAAAARQIAAADMQQLTALCEKSLLAHAPATGRYSLHSVIRAYAAEHLPENDHTAQQHARYYLTMLAQHSEPLQKHSPQDSLRVIDPDIENLRLAWDTGLAQRRSDWLLDALVPLSLYYQLRGLSHEGEVTMCATSEAAAAWGPAGKTLAARAGIEHARFQNRLGQFWPAMQTVQAALKLTTDGADGWAEGMAHVIWGESLWRLGKYQAARNNLAQALTIGQALGSTQLIGWCHHHQGVINDIQGHYDTARTHLQQACVAWQKLDNATTLSVSLNSLGLVCHHQGDLTAAQKFMEQAQALCEHIGHRHLQALLLNNLSMVAIEQGDYQGAQQHLQRGLGLAANSGNLTGQAEIYANLGKTYRLLNDTARAIEHLEQGLRIAEEIGNRPSVAYSMLNLADARHAHGELPRAQALYQQALQIAEHDNLSHVKCEVLIGLARLLSDIDQPQARRYSIEALALARSIGNPQLLERANAVARTLHPAPALAEQIMSA